MAAIQAARIGAFFAWPVSVGFRIPLILREGRLTYHLSKGFGSGIYTAKQTRRVRHVYDIPGSYGDDVVKGIFCQPCSQIRNELEVRARETEKQQLELGYLRLPVPAGENYRPMHNLPVTVPYQPQPVMKIVSPTPIDRQFLGPNFPSYPPGPARVVPLYPEDFGVPGRDKSNPGQGTASEYHVSDTTSPRHAGRRSKILTPINESNEEVKQAENSPPLGKSPRIHEWLLSMTPNPDGNLPTIEHLVLMPGPGSPPTIVPTLDIPSMNLREPRPTSPNIAIPSPTQARTEVLGPVPVPRGPGQVRSTAEAQKPMPAMMMMASGQDHNLGAHPTVSNSKDKTVRDHKIDADERVAAVQAIKVPTHNLDSHRQLPLPETVPPREHDISRDESIEVAAVFAKEHDLAADIPAGVITPPLSSNARTRT